MESLPRNYAEAALRFTEICPVVSSKLVAAFPDSDKKKMVGTGASLKERYSIIASWWRSQSKTQNTKKASRFRALSPTEIKHNLDVRGHSKIKLKNLRKGVGAGTFAIKLVSLVIHCITHCCSSLHRAR